MEIPSARSLLVTDSTYRPRVLLVDDEDEMLQLLKLMLERAGARILVAASGREALRQAYDQRPDAILLDIRMPDLDGLTVCQRLRALMDAPILMVTASDAPDDVTSAFVAGADDFITKPFDLSELLARLQACLRRARAMDDVQNCLVLGNGDLIIDLRRHSTRAGEREVHLTRTEFDLLVYMARNRGRVLTHVMLKSVIWGEDAPDHYDCLKQFIGGLRRKIEPDPCHPRWLINEHGVGYVLDLT